VRPVRSPRRDQGSAGLELVGLLPVLLLTGMIALQAGVAMWTAASTSEAARSAARAYSLGRDPQSAAEGSLPGTIDVVGLALTGPGHGVRLTTEVPRVAPIPVIRVTREVVMP
jgi:hypothetical protein